MNPRLRPALAALALAAALSACAAPPPAPPAPAAPEATVPAPAAEPSPAAPSSATFPAGADDEARAAEAFGRLQGMAGTWEGDFQMGEQRGRAAVDYRLTGGGSAVEETLFRGTPHEMVTMYYRDGPRLLLTHYCAAGNQPTMVLVGGSDPAVLNFEFVGATNLRSPADGHMHRAVLDFSNSGRLKSSWTYHADGKPGPIAVIDLIPAK